MVLTKQILTELNPEKWSGSEIDSVLKLEKTKTVSVKDTINIYLFYWTSWIENGKLQFRDDIYELDKALFQKLQNHN